MPTGIIFRKQCNVRSNNLFSKEDDGHNLVEVHEETLSLIRELFPL